MLDAHAHREGLRLHRDAAAEEHAVGVARRVADAEEGDIGFDALLVVDDDGLDALFAEFEVRDLRAEAHGAAEAYDLLADVAHDLAQDVRADVRLVQIADLLGRAAATNASMTSFMCASLMRVVSLPSENVPARPRRTARSTAG